MEFAVADERKGASASLAPAAPARSRSKLPEGDDEAEEARLRQLYQTALASQFGGALEAAAHQFDALLAHALLRPSQLARDAGSVTDAFEDGVGNLRARLNMRFLALKNRGRVEEDLCAVAASAAAAAASNAPDAALPAATPVDANSSSSVRTLHFYISAVEAGSIAEQLTSKLRRLQAEEASGGGATAAFVAVTEPEAVVDDVDLWIRVARTALSLKKYTLARQALETAFKLQPTNFFVIEPLVDLIFAVSDFFPLLSLVSHSLRLDPWHVRSLVTQRALWRLDLPQVGMADTEAFVILEHTLEQIEPHLITEVEASLQASQARYAADAVAVAAAPPLISLSPVDLTDS